MSENFSVSITEVADHFGIKSDPKAHPDAVSYNVKCPVCDDVNSSKYHCNIVKGKNLFHCPKCGTGGGVLDFYSLIRFGHPASVTGTGKTFRALTEDLKIEHKEIQPCQKKKQPEYHEIKPAADDRLNKAYQALLSLPYLALNSEHRLNLLRRGLHTIAIAANQYGSNIMDDWLPSHPDFEKTKAMYRKSGLEKIRLSLPKLKNTSRLAIIAGIIIAQDILRKGISLKQVPGFFKIGGIWCLKVDEGMLIPTRNRKGEIVGIQIRTKAEYRKGLRYITLSSKDLDEGPTTEISRIHFPLRNSAIENAEMIGITEGPLKADIAVELTGKPVYIMAVQGVNNIRELPQIIDYLKEHSVSQVFNLLDMDRFVNHFVEKAAITMEAKFNEKSIEFVSSVWDKESFNALIDGIIKTAMQYQIKLPIFKQREEDHWINSVFSLFAENNYSLSDCYHQVTNKKFEWSSETKGIDDYLKYINDKKKEKNGKSHDLFC